VVKKLILIGASTGGPGRLHTILENLPHDFCSAIIIAQHMVPFFIPSFVKQLSVSTEVKVQAVYDRIEILPSTVYVCSGECKLIEKDGYLRIVQTEPPEFL
jgi:two-component system chemotaxis response regulator CheB